MKGIYVEILAARNALVALVSPWVAPSAALKSIVSEPLVPLVSDQCPWTWPWPWLITPSGLSESPRAARQENTGHSEMLAWDLSSDPMSNYSVYFLLQAATLYTNCTVYLLISGLIVAQDYDALSWLNLLAHFLPAYYVTNCSIETLVQEIRQQNLSAGDVSAWLDDYYLNPYNVADNGDLFVALLYTLLGLCVSCWMLMFLILLLPKHKRKPLLTMLAMLVYLLVLTAILVKVTDVTRAEYYADSLDMVRLLSLTVETPFTICLAILELLTNLAYLQLILKLSRHRWRRVNFWFVLFLTAACLVAYSVLVSRVDSPAAFVTAAFDASKSGHIALNIVFMAWFAGNLGYYTVCGTATTPRQVSYARKLLPLAFLTWANIAIYLLVSILMLSLWSDTWLVNVWVSFLPTLLKMCLLITSWEWLYLIRHIEQKLELGDVLGRRISVDDERAFNNDKNVRSVHGRFPLLHFFAKDGLKNVSSKNESNESEEESKGSQNNQHSNADLEGLQDDASYQELNVNWDLSDEEGPEQGEAHENVENQDSQRNMESQRTERSDDARQLLRNEEATENSQTNGGHSREMSDSPNIPTQNSLRAEELPSFTPHPGYSVDDYWEEKGSRNG